ncbi:hypothetical protein L615_002700000320 [Nocardioides sp. J9]|nr:hypothetical protein L615_002700000320 [Nocardioides sp. J9]
MSAVAEVEALVVLDGFAAEVRHPPLAQLRGTALCGGPGVVVDGDGLRQVECEQLDEAGRELAVGERAEVGDRVLRVEARVGPGAGVVGGQGRERVGGVHAGEHGADVAVDDLRPGAAPAVVLVAGRGDVPQPELPTGVVDDVVGVHRHLDAALGEGATDEGPHLLRVLGAEERQGVVGVGRLDRGSVGVTPAPTTEQAHAVVGRVSRVR